MTSIGAILAGSKAAGPAGLSLAWFAPQDTEVPTDATTALASDFKDAGACDPKGIDVKTNTSTTPIKVFGTLATVGTLFTDQSQTIDVTFMETNAIAVAVYRSVALDSITVDATGAFTVKSGVPTLTNYVAVFDAFSSDGSPIRYVAPNVQNTTPGDLTIAMGSTINRPVTLSLLPDDSGYTLYEHYVVSALATGDGDSGGTGGE